MVEFLVRVPDHTHPDERLFLAGDHPSLGGWSADGCPLHRWDDGTHRAYLDIPPGTRVRFLVTQGRWRDAEGCHNGREHPPREVVVPDDGTVEAWVARWGRTAVKYHHDFRSQFLPHGRTVTVWTPPGYDHDPDRRYPVFYLHDGQNLFDPLTAFAGNPWWADEVTERVVRRGEVPPVLLVGVANTPDRLNEYGPRRCGPKQADDLSRGYARMVVEEVKPFIDATYRTRPEPDHTAVGGSSMGGLISLHLAKWHPNVFGHVAAMSPSLWWDKEYFLRNVHVNPRWLDRCRVWLDVGGREGATKAGMRGTARRAERLAELLAGHGLAEGERYRFLEVREAGHNERAWGERFDEVLRFLFGTNRNNV